MSDEYKKWILQADPRSLIHQIDEEVRAPMVTAQNILNMLWLMQNPSQAIQRRIDAGELNQEQMLSDVAELIERVFAVLDLYKNTLDGI